MDAIGFEEIHGCSPQAGWRVVVSRKRFGSSLPPFGLVKIERHPNGRLVAGTFDNDLVDRKTAPEISFEKHSGGVRLSSRPTADVISVQGERCVPVVVRCGRDPCGFPLHLLALVTEMQLGDAPAIGGTAGLLDEADLIGDASGETVAVAPHGLKLLFYRCVDCFAQSYAERGLPGSDHDMRLIAFLNTE